MSINRNGRPSPSSTRTNQYHHSFNWTAKGALDSHDEALDRSSSSTNMQHVRLPALLFLLSLLVPATFTFGTLSLSPYRIVLLACFLPCFISWLSGGAGKILLTDFLLLAFCIWCFVCLIVKQGVGSSMATFGMQLIETMGAYLLARCFIRTADDFLALARTLFWILLYLLPLAIIEAVTGRNVALEALAHIMPASAPLDEGIRMGLHRVQNIMPHPILFGVFASSCFSFVILVLCYGAPIVTKLIKGFAIALVTLLSLSSAPISSLVIQLALLTWDRTLRSFSGRWALLIGLISFVYVAIGLVSNQGVVGVYITYLTFNTQTGFYRVAIWEYGTASVANNPMFGVGMGEWVRASWMTSSIDNFWLLNAIRWGAVGGALLVLSVLTAVLHAAFNKQSDPRVAQYKLAYILAILVHIFTGWTVHFWGPSYAFFMFLLGSGGWLAGEQGITRSRIVRKAMDSSKLVSRGSASGFQGSMGSSPQQVLCNRLQQPTRRLSVDRSARRSEVDGKTLGDRQHD